MKCSIIITGQISGNFTLKRAIGGYFEEKRTMFNGFELFFKTKKEAKKELWEAYKFLRSDKTDAQNSRLSYSKYGTLSYDASTAKIVTTNE